MSKNHITKIHHRINTLAALLGIDSAHGVEIDVRYHNDDLIICHDPFGHHLEGHLTLLEFAQNYKCQGPLILNLKTEGIERRCIEVMNNFGIHNWFFLDMSQPYLIKFAEEAQEKKILGFTPENLSVRFSEYEPIEYAMAFVGKARWVWVDCFYDLPKLTELALLKKHFKLIIVSPELHGHSLDKIEDYKSRLEAIGPDAVCSKRVDLW